MRSIEEWKSLLRAKLRQTLGARDPHSVAVLREVLAAFDNAEAPPIDTLATSEGEAFAGSVAGLGAGEVARLVLSPEAVAAIIEREIHERRQAAHTYAKLGRDEEARVLILQIGVLEALYADVT